MATVLVKARVSRLESIPWFFNFTEGSEPESNCWTAQCEILLTRMLGAQPQDEDFPPEDPDDVNPNNFEYFGFGQLGQGPANLPGGPQQPPLGPPNQNAGGAWAPWPLPEDINQIHLGPIQQPGQHDAVQDDEAPPCSQSRRESFLLLKMILSILLFRTCP